jgi:DNA-binding XRE family transcriptional regulator
MANEHPLREYRKTAGLTLEALAEKADVTAPTLSRIETWQAEPSLALISRLIKLSRGKLSADDFLE